MTTSNPIDNSENIINTRDIDIRIDYLAFLDDPDLSPEDKDLWEDEITELANLRELWSDLSENRDVQLIRESYFGDYAREFADEIYGLDGNGASAYFDYEKFADEYQSDFSSIEFDGVTYYHLG